MSEPDSTDLITLRCPRSIDRQAIRDFCIRLRTEIADGRTFTCLLTDDRELRRLNREFLQKDYATDVLSFPSADGPELGDLAISVQRAQEQSREFGHSTEDEIRILLLHGVLHLLGMDHEADRGRMARREKQLRRKLSLPDGLIERAAR